MNPSPLIILTEETGEGARLPLALEGLPATNAAGESIHYCRMRIVPKPPEGREWKDVKDGSTLDMKRARLDEWSKNTNALIAAGRKPFVNKRHDFETPDPEDTLGVVERLERDADELYAVVGLHGDEALKIAARNSRSIGVAGKDARDAKGGEYEGEWLHHLTICPNPALPGLEGFERIAASATSGSKAKVFALAATEPTDAEIEELRAAGHGEKTYTCGHKSGCRCIHRGDPRLAINVTTPCHECQKVDVGPSKLLLQLASDAAGFPVSSRTVALFVLAEDVPAPDPLATYVRDVADRMGLKDWTIRIDPEPNPNPSAVASIRCIYGQRSATIWLCSDWASRTPEAKRNDIVHELVHCHGAAVDSLMLNEVAEQLAPAANDILQASYTRAMEYQTDGLAGAIAPLMPLPPDDAVPVAPPATPTEALSADGYSYSSTQLDVGGQLAADILAYGLSIPDEDLAAGGRETDVHVTAKYGLLTSDPSDVERVVRGFGSVLVTLGDTSVFTKPAKSDAEPGYDVVKIEVRGADLIRLNRLLTDSLPCVTTFPTYVPHLTVAYLKAGLGAKYAADQRFAGQVLVFDRLTFSDQSGLKDSISLAPRYPDVSYVEDAPMQSRYAMSLAC